MTKRTGEMSNWVVVLVIVFLLVSLLGLWSKSQQCKARGGVLLKGFWSYHCARILP